MSKETDVRMKNGLKTEGVKGNNFKRKRSQNKSVKQQETRKMVPSENRVKRMRCGEKRIEGLKKKRCPKIRMPRERDVNGKRLKRHRFPETAMTSEETCQERRGVKSPAPELSTSRAVKIQKCQKQAGSREASDKDVESKKSQGQRPPRDHAVDGRASQAVKRCSYRLFLVFIGSSLSQNFHHPAGPGFTCMIHSYAKNYKACPGLYTIKRSFPSQGINSLEDCSDNNFIHAQEKSQKGMQSATWGWTTFSSSPQVSCHQNIEGKNKLQVWTPVPTSFCLSHPLNVSKELKE